MLLKNFLEIDLKIGDYIWIMNEKGEGFHGNYGGNYNPAIQTFQFRNHSNGKLQTIDIIKLQRLEINQRL